MIGAFSDFRFCPTCGRKLWSPEALRQHEASHSVGELPTAEPQARVTNWADLNQPGTGQAFEGDGSFHALFSNFAGPGFWVGRAYYPTREHYFQAMKTGDAVWRDRIRNAKDPGQAKVLGRQAPLRAEWDAVKGDVMLTAIRAACEASPLLKATLRTYRGNIVEWNTWHDRVWGVCVCPECGTTGENILGRALEYIREELQK